MCRGLLAGAHEGAGLGLRFLAHLQRCRLLLHVVDGAGDDPSAGLQTALEELRLSGAKPRPSLLALNKSDLLGEEEAGALAARLAEESGLRAFAVSAKTGAGCEALSLALAAELPPLPPPDADSAPDADLSEQGEARAAYTLAPDTEDWDDEIWAKEGAGEGAEKGAGEPA